MSCENFNFLNNVGEKNISENKTTDLKYGIVTVFPSYRH